MEQTILCAIVPEVYDWPDIESGSGKLKYGT